MRAYTHTHTEKGILIHMADTVIHPGKARVATATGYDAGENEVPLVNLNWGNSNNGVTTQAPITGTNTTKVTAVGPVGTSDLIAMSLGKQGNGTVTVEPGPLDRIEITWGPEQDA